jgi:hypothetical protein
VGLDDHRDRERQDEQRPGRGQVGEHEQHREGDGAFAEERPLPGVGVDVPQVQQTRVERVLGPNRRALRRGVAVLGRMAVAVLGRVAVGALEPAHLPPPRACTKASTIRSTA